MNTPIDSINSIADCDMLLANMNTVKKELENRADLIRLQLMETNVNSEDLFSSIALTKAQIQQLKLSIPNLPLSELKNRLEINLLNLRQKLKNLEQAEQNMSSVALYMKYFEISCIEANINIVSANILALARRKSVLSQYPDIAA